MNKSAKKVIAIVAVIAGGIFCQLAISSNQLDARENQPTARIDDHQQTRGVVIKTTYFSVRLKSDEDGLVTFYIPEKNKLSKHQLSQSLKGDQVTIQWEKKDGRKWVHGIEGKRIPKEKHQTQGVVVKTTYFSVKLKSDDDGLVTFYVPKKDKLVNDKISELRKGDQVTIRWDMEDSRKWIRIVESK